jgi:hypothetical protein
MLKEVLKFLFHNFFLYFSGVIGEVLDPAFLEEDA